MTRTQILASAAFAAVLLAPGLAMAQQTGGYPPGTPVSEIERREQAETARLNNEVLARDAQTAAANQAVETEAEAIRIRNEAAQAEYEAALARYNAEVAANAAANAAEQARYEAEMAAWRRAGGRPQ